MSMVICFFEKMNVNYNFRDLLGERNLYCYKNRNELIFHLNTGPYLLPIILNIDNVDCRICGNTMFVEMIGH